MDDVQDSAEIIEKADKICKSELKTAQTPSRTWNSSGTSVNRKDSLSDYSSKKRVMFPSNRHGDIISAGDPTSCIRSCSPSDVLETDVHIPRGPVFIGHLGNTAGYKFEDHLPAGPLLTDMTISSGDSTLPNQFGPIGHGRLPVRKSLSEGCAYPVLHRHVSSKAPPSRSVSYSFLPHDSLFRGLRRQSPCSSLTQDSWSNTDRDVTSSITPSDPLTHESEPRSAQLDLYHDKWAYLDGPDECLHFELWDYGVDVHPEQRHRAKWEVTDKHGNVLYEGTMFPTRSQ